jgi:hypothetical protein
MLDSEGALSLLAVTRSQARRLGIAPDDIEDCVMEFAVRLFDPNVRTTNARFYLQNPAAGTQTTSGDIRRGWGDRTRTPGVSGGLRFECASSFLKGQFHACQLFPFSTHYACYVFLQGADSK